MIIHLVGAQQTNYPWGFENRLIPAINGLGHTLISTDYRKQRPRLPDLLAQKADLTLVCKGEGIDPHLVESVPCVTAIWYAEQIGTPESHDETSIARRKELAFNLHAFDYAFSHDPANLLVYKRLGAQRVFPLPCAAVDPVLNHKLDTPKKHDVVFVGSKTSRRKKILEALTGKGIEVYSPDIWDPEKLNILFNESRIVLNLHLSDLLNTETRVAEVLGAGSFLLSETLSDPDLVRAGTHFVQFSSGDIEELVDSIRYYLAHENEREAIALNGYRFIHENHTYTNRIRTILETVDFSLNRRIWPSYSLGVPFNTRLKPTLRLDRYDAMVKERLKSELKLGDEFVYSHADHSGSEDDFRSSDYWEKRYLNGGNSGNGSYGRLAHFKAQCINSFISQKNIKSAIEFGVGDGHNLSFYNIEKYFGLDVSMWAIEICQNRYKNDKSKQFSAIGPLEVLSITEKFDCALSIDVLYHLVEQNVYETHLRNLFASAKKYVIIYAWDADADESMRLSTHVKPRKFTEYISENFKEWRLIGTKEQIYPESSSDFYFYEKSRTACGQIPQSSATYPSAVPAKMHFEAYRNDGWGLSRSAFQQLYGIITASKKSPFRIIEFGSGISTQFLVDCALRNTSKKIEILSFDNDPEYIFKPKNNYDFLKILLRNLLECDDEQYNHMFAEKKYLRELMHHKVTPLATRQKNNFYDIRDGDITDYYDLMIVDGPNGNGRNIAFLHMRNHLQNGSYVLIDDFTHYDFIDRFKSLYTAEEVFKCEAGMTNQWENGGDFIIYRLI